MSNHWFLPKSHGYGATPANWKGWMATAILFLLVLLLAAVLLVFPRVQGHSPTVGHIAMFVVGEAVLVLAFVHVARKRTLGDWRWRWGRSEP